MSYIYIKTFLTHESRRRRNPKRKPLTGENDGGRGANHAEKTGVRGGSGVVRDTGHLYCVAGEETGSDSGTDFTAKLTATLPRTVKCRRCDCMRAKPDSTLTDARM